MAPPLWLALGLWVVPTMSRMMRTGGTVGERTMGNGMMGEMTTGGGMMGMMATQWVAMLGLVGIFLYLIVDALRESGHRRDARMEGRPRGG